MSTDTNRPGQEQSTTTQPTIIGEACRLVGELHLEGDVTILGAVEGQVRVTGQLKLGREARVSGTVRAGTMQLSGRIEGNIVCSEALRLEPSATLVGDLFATSLAIEEGATCRGQIMIGADAIEAAEKILQAKRAPAQANAAAATNVAPGSASVDQREVSPLLGRIDGGSAASEVEISPSAVARIVRSKTAVTRPSAPVAANSA